MDQLRTVVVRKDLVQLRMVETVSPQRLVDKLQQRPRRQLHMLDIHEAIWAFVLDDAKTVVMALDYDEDLP
jgi:hypothetical protein